MNKIDQLKSFVQSIYKAKYKYLVYGPNHKLYYNRFKKEIGEYKTQIGFKSKIEYRYTDFKYEIILNIFVGHLIKNSKKYLGEYSLTELLWESRKK